MPSKLIITFKFSFAAIVLLNIVAFAPAFIAKPRSDQLIYLANAQPKKDLMSLTAGNYSYDREVQAMGGTDYRLFRPVLFFILGVEKWLFSDNWLLWQIPGFALHLCVLWWLLKICRRHYDGMPAYLLTLFFGLMPAGMEMVAWNHIQGYLVFLVCILMVFDRIQQWVTFRAVTWKQLWLTGAILLPAIFAYELGFLYCFFLALYAAASLPPDNVRSKTQPSRLFSLLVLSAPGVLYIVLNILDLSRHGMDMLSKYPPPTQAMAMPQLILTWLKAWLWWIYVGLFPGQTQFLIEERTLVMPVWALKNQPLFMLPSVAAAALAATGIGLAIVWIYGFLHSISRAFIRRHRNTLALIAGMLCAFTIIIVLGRASYAGLNEALGTNSYYTYFFWLLFVLLLYHAMPFDRLRLMPGAPVYKRIAVTVLVILIGANFFITSQRNMARYRHDERQIDLLSQSRALVNLHKNEPGFSFGVDAALYPFVYLDWAKRPLDPTGQGHTSLQLLYPEYYTADNPCFIFTLTTDGKLHLIETPPNTTPPA